MRSLEDYEPILSRILRLCARKTSFQSAPPLGQILSENSRLVVVVNHSTPLSWLPASALLVANACARGAGKRVPMGVMDRFFFEVPLIRDLAHVITQSDQPLTFKDLIAAFDKRTDDSLPLDLVIFPEGSNCFFGDSYEIQEFRSPRFAEIAIRTRTPILIAVHYGSEKWAAPIEVPKSIINKIDLLPSFARDFLQKRLEERGTLVVPLWPSPMKKFAMKCELYFPTTRLEDLSQNDKERTKQISIEAEKVRARMQTLLAELKEPAALADE